jgi:cytochrome c oxidase subunit II
VTRSTRWALVLAAGSLAAGCSGNPNALNPQGQGALEISNLWWLMITLATLVSILVIALLVGSWWRGRRPLRPHAVDEATADERGRRWIVWGGVIMPVLILVPVSFVTVRTGARLAAPQDTGDLIVEVIGHQFWFEARYPEAGAVTANEIHIPTNTSVELQLTSADVIHSFWAPNLHGKLDMNPGEVNSLHIDALEAGTYRGFCTEFCGIQHAGMQLIVVAQEPDEFEAWLEANAAPAAEPAGDLAAGGEEVFAAVGCASCHAVRGTAFDAEVGPDLTHFASRRTIGSALVENNRGNLSGWIANPQTIKPGNLMPPTPLSAEQLQALLAYLEGLE